MELGSSALHPRRSNSEEIDSSPAATAPESPVTLRSYGAFPVLPIPIVIPVMTATPACFETNSTNTDNVLVANPCATTIQSQMAPVDLADAASRMLKLAMMAERKRESMPLLYNNSPERTILERELNSCLVTAPLYVAVSVSEKLAAIKSALSEQSALCDSDAQQAAFLALAYHTAYCIISSPPETHRRRKSVDEKWIHSAAFVEANDHAIKSTQILMALLEVPGLPDVVRFVEFQWCVLRTGLLHQAFVDASEMAGEHGHWLAAEAKSYIALHSTALLRAHEANGIVGTPWWIDEWPARKEELAGDREGHGFWDELDLN